MCGSETFVLRYIYIEVYFLVQLREEYLTFILAWET